MDATQASQDRQALIESHCDMARFVARRYHHRSLDREDIDQIAVLAAIGAIDGYDPARGASLRTHVWRQVEYAISDVVRRATRQGRSMSRLTIDPIDRSHDDDAIDSDDDLWAAMETLPHADQERLIDHYGLDGYPAMTFLQLSARGMQGRRTAGNRNTAALALLRTALTA